MTMTACILNNICIRAPDADNELLMEHDHTVMRRMRGKM